VIARVLPSGDPIATVSVLDTTGEPALGRTYGLSFSRTDRVVRYTHMAVLDAYRGLNLPLYMLLEARRLCVVPRDFEYTWLLFPRHRAAASLYHTLLSFTAGPEIVESEQGPSCVLSRDEKSHEAEWADAQAASFLARTLPGDIEFVRVGAAFPHEDADDLPCTCQREPSFALVGDDEWVAQ